MALYHSGKQKYECLACRKQFVEEPQNKIISDDLKERIRRSLLERVSLEGICRIFDVSTAIPAEVTITLTMTLKQVNAETGRHRDAEGLRKS